MTCRVQARPPETKRPKCPACKALFPVSFVFFGSGFPADRQLVGGKAIVCPSNGCLLWVSFSGEVKAISGCGDDELRELFEIL